MSVAGADRVEALGPGERWLADERRVLQPPGGLVERTVDLTHAAPWLEAQTRGRLPWALALLIVRAAAMVLGRRPDLHTVVAGYRTSQPGSVDVGLSCSEVACDAPIVVGAADRKPLAALAPAIAAAARNARSASGAGLSGWARLLGLGWVRRALLRWLLGSFGFRRRRGGSFHVTCVGGADVVAPLRFYGGSALGAGRLRHAFVAVDGRLELRHVVSLVLVVDHTAMDGVRAAALLNEIAGTLEGDELTREMDAFASGPDLDAAKDAPLLVRDSARDVLADGRA